jgi:hypothetical protein
VEGFESLHAQIPERRLVMNAQFNWKKLPEVVNCLLARLLVLA